MSLIPSIATPTAPSIRVSSVDRRAWSSSRLVLLLVLWGAAISAACQLEELAGPIPYSLRGPWGCTGPTSALVADHSVWLMLLRLQAELLDHQAELESVSLHVSAHDPEMAEHAAKIGHHESTGDAAEHAEHVALHKDLMKRHAELQTSSNELSGHHVE